MFSGPALPGACLVGLCCDLNISLIFLLTSWNLHVLFCSFTSLHVLFFFFFLLCDIFSDLPHVTSAKDYRRGWRDGQEEMFVLIRDTVCQRIHFTYKSRGVAGLHITLTYASWYKPWDCDGVLCTPSRVLFHLNVVKSLIVLCSQQFQLCCHFLTIGVILPIQENCVKSSEED